MATSEKVGGVYQRWEDFSRLYDLGTKAWGIGGKLAAHDLNFLVAKEGPVISGAVNHNDYDHHHYDMDTTQPNGYQSTSVQRKRPDGRDTTQPQRGRPHGPDVPFSREREEMEAYSKKRFTPY